MRLKSDMRIMYNIFLICYLEKKSKNITTNEDTQFNVNWFVLQELGEFTWRVSDCEELVGVSYRSLNVWSNLILQRCITQR